LALTDFSVAINLDISLTEAYYNRGWVYYNIEDYKSATNDLNIAIKLEPSAALPYYYRGLIYDTEGKNNLAIADLKKTLELTTDPRLIDKAEKRLTALTSK